jgi:MFS transporter, DHA1 family, inner membrane transport protein
MRTDWRLILLLYAAGLLAAGQFAKISLTLAMLERHWPGMPIPYAVSALSVTGMLFGVTAGVIIARLGVRRVLLAGLVAGAALSALEALLPPFPVFFALRLVEGAAHLAIVVAAPTLMAAVAAPRDKPVAMGLWGTFFGVGFALAALAVPRLGSAPAVYLAHGALLLCLAAALAPLLPRGVTGLGAPAERIWARHLAIYSSLRATAPALGFFFHTVLFLGLLTYLPRFFGAWTGPVLPLMALIGTFGAGFLARRFAPPAIGMAGLLLTGAGMLALLLLPDAARPWAALPVFVVTGLLAGASFATVPYLNPDPADQARANGAIAQLGNVGTALSTPLIGATLGIGVAGPLWVAVVLSLTGFAALALIRARLGRPA